MFDEKSCGGILFTYENDALKFLLIANQDGIYGFPKGHVEGNETEAETAKREIYEEVGINASFIEEFRECDAYRLFSKVKNKEA